MNKQKQNKINKIISEYRLMAYNSKNPFIKKFCYEKADELEKKLLINK